MHFTPQEQKVRAWSWNLEVFLTPIRPNATEGKGLDACPTHFGNFSDDVPERIYPIATGKKGLTTSLTASFQYFLYNIDSKDLIRMWLWRKGHSNHLLDRAHSRSSLATSVKWTYPDMIWKEGLIVFFDRHICKEIGPLAWV